MADYRYQTQAPGQVGARAEIDQRLAELDEVDANTCRRRSARSTLLTAMRCSSCAIARRWSDRNRGRSGDARRAGHPAGGGAGVLRPH